MNTGPSSASFIPATRYYVGYDVSAHKYLVPWDRKYEWNDWCALGEDDPVGWEAPAFAKRIDGGTLTFCDPQIL